LCNVIWYNTVKEINKVNKLVKQDGAQLDMVVALTRSVTAATNNTVSIALQIHKNKPKN